MSDDVGGYLSRLAVMMLLALIAVLVLADLAIDYRQGVGLSHLGIELVVLLAATAGIAVLWLRFEKTRSDLRDARGVAAHWQAENRELLLGLGRAIAQQFARWMLTDAESEVGLLLLKGLSHKEIAALRETSERTVREQARAIYRKAGLAGRSSLAAFFLEELLLPEDRLDQGRGGSAGLRGREDRRS